MVMETLSTTDPAVFLREDNVASKLVSCAIRFFNGPWLQSFLTSVLEILAPVAAATEISATNSPVVKKVLDLLLDSANDWSR
jgi:hypothetical protein